MSTTSIVRDSLAALGEAGLRGSIVVRDVRTGEQVAVEPDVEYPSASLVKLALALAVADRLRTGELDGSSRVEVEPGRADAPGPMGLSRFQHPATVAVEDLLYLSTAVSDNIAADALFGLVPPQEVAATLADAGVQGLTVRHGMKLLADTPAERLGEAQVHLAHALAIGALTAQRGHPLAELDIARANTGTATAFADLLQELWSPTRVHPDTAARVRGLMRHNVVRHRLTPDFTADDTLWSSKTGTLLNLRHEVGVVEHADGQVMAVAVLTESRVPASAQPAAEARMSQVARGLHDHLRNDLG